MDSQSFPASDLPGTSKLYAAYLNDFRKVAGFYAHPPVLKSIHKVSKGVSLPAGARATVVEVLRAQNSRWGTDSSVDGNLRRLADGAFAVVTGQQTGLLTGPAYSIYKAITAIAVAKQLTKQGLAAVPVFWMATEDHDLAEVNQSHWLLSDGLSDLRLDVNPSDQGRTVGEVALGISATAVAKHASDLLEGPEAARIAEMISAALQAEETYGSSFAKLFAKIFEGRGLILLDPRAPEFHRLAIPQFRAAIEGRSKLIEKLLPRGKALEKAGFHVQVKVTEASTPLFLEVEGKRTAVRQRGDKLHAGPATFSEAELLALLDAHPERFSGNALFRPVVQDCLLPTVATICGPAEIAYLAQSEVLYREVLGRMPVVLPRASFTLVEPHVARLLKKYRLTLQNVFAGAGRLRGRLEGDSLPVGMKARFDRGEKEVRSLLKKLSTALAKLDNTLQGATATSERKILYQIEKLRHKAGRAYAFRAGVLDRHEETLLNALLPHKEPQERSLCLLPFLARHGMRLLDELERKASSTGQHHALFL